MRGVFSCKVQTAYWVRTYLVGRLCFYKEDTESDTIEAMGEPYNTWRVGRFDQKIAFGRSVPRVITDEAAIYLAWHLVNQVDASDSDVAAALYQLFQLLLSKQKPEE